MSEEVENSNDGTLSGKYIDQLIENLDIETKKNITII